MADPDMVAAMVFSLVLVVLVGGFILIYPLSRRLGRLLDDKAARDQKQQERPAAAELHVLREQIHALDSEVRLLTERQAFMEQLLERREVDALPKGQRVAL